MIFKKFTNKGKPVIILIHGGGLSWWNYKDEIMLLKDDFLLYLRLCKKALGRSDTRKYLLPMQED